MEDDFALLEDDVRTAGISGRGRQVDEDLEGLLGCVEIGPLDELQSGFLDGGIHCHLDLFLMWFHASFTLSVICSVPDR